MDAWSLFFLPCLCAIPLVIIAIFVSKDTHIFDFKDKTEIQSTDKSLLQVPDTSPKGKTLFFSGCGFLITSAFCLAAFPISLMIVLGLGMSGDFEVSIVALSMVGLLLNIVFIIAFGIIGAILLSIWAIKKYKTRLA